LVYWPLMGGLLHLIQWGGGWVGPQPAHSPPCCTNFILYDVALSLLRSKGLTKRNKKKKLVSTKKCDKGSKKGSQTNVRDDSYALAVLQQVQCQDIQASSAGTSPLVLAAQTDRQENAACPWTVGHTSLEQSARRVLQAVCQTCCLVPHPNLQYQSHTINNNYNTNYA